MDISRAFTIRESSHRIHNPFEFAAAARRSADEAATRQLTAFPRRSPADRSPAAMYHVESRDADGFRFVFQDPYKH